MGKPGTLSVPSGKESFPGKTVLAFSISCRPSAGPQAESAGVTPAGVADGLAAAGLSKGCGPPLCARGSERSDGVGAAAPPLVPL